MQITDVRISLALGEGKLRGYAAVTFDNCFAVHGIKILEGSDGFFLAMPSREAKKGERRDIAHPINSAFRTELQAKILEAFNMLDASAASA